MGVLDRFRLDGKVALVTGGTKGLGRAMAEALASAGASVALTGRDGSDRPRPSPGSSPRPRGARRSGIGADVAKSAEVKAMVARVLDAFGRLDILVNNAGINIRRPIEKLEEAECDRVIATNLNGPWLCCRAAAEPMRRQKWGRVINVSSTLGEVGLADRTPYCSSKGGLTLMTRTLALEWARDGINVNALCPGPFATEINRPLLDDPVAREAHAGQGPPGPLGRPGRTRPRRRLPRLRGLQLRHRRHDPGRRRLHGPVRLGRPSRVRIPQHPRGPHERIDRPGPPHRLPGRRRQGGDQAFGRAGPGRPGLRPRLLGRRDVHDQPGRRRAGPLGPVAPALGLDPGGRHQRGQRQRGDRPAGARQRPGHRRRRGGDPRAAGPSRSWSPRPA